MHEIKFRAWDKDSRMSYMEDNGYFRRAFCSQDTKIWQDVSLGLLIKKYNKDEIILMQYTGLKDKNGKKVYEDDFVQMTGEPKGSVIINADDPSPNMRIIVFEEESAGFVFAHIDGKTGVSGFTLCKNNLATLYEIIGNVHENPELLENKDA